MHRTFNSQAKGRSPIGRLAQGLEVLAAVAAFASSAAAAEAHPAPAPGGEDTFVVLRTTGEDSELYSLADDLSGKVRDGHLCVDLAEFSQALEFPIEVDSQRQQASGWFFDEARTLQLDVKAGAVTISKRSRPLQAADVTPTADGLCVDVHALGSWLGLKLTYDQSAAMVEVKAFEPLPFMKRLKRKNQRSSLKSGAGDESQIRARPLAYTWFTPPTLDVSIDATSTTGAAQPFQAGANVSVLAVGEVAKFTGEMMLQTQGAQFGSLRARLYRHDAPGGVFGVKDLTEFAIGDVTGLADDIVSAGGSGRGVSISSFPTGVADRFSASTLTGDLPDGWDAELYRNDVLIGSQGSDGTGRYTFTGVSILPGANVLKIILFGPQGQRLVIDRSVQAAPLIVPKGKIYSRLTIFQQATNLFGGSHGVSGLPSAGVWAEAEVRATPIPAVTTDLRLTHYDYNDALRNFAAASAATTLMGSAVQLTGVVTDHQGYGAQLAMDERFKGVYLTLHLEQYANHFSSERVDADILRRIALDLNTTIKVFGGKSASITVRSNVDTRYDHTTAWSLNGQSGMSFERNWITQSLVLSGQTVAASTASLLDLTPSTTTTSPAPAGLAPTTLNGSTQWSRVSPSSSLRWQFDYSLAPQATFQRVNLGYTPTPDMQRPHWQFGGNLSYAPTTRLTTVGLSTAHVIDKTTLAFHATFDSHKTFAFGMTLAFSIGRDAARNRWEIEPRSEARRGRTVARVYEDVNNNGVYDVGDRLLPDAEVSVSGSEYKYKTNSNGKAMLYGLEPETQLQIKVDPDSISKGTVAASSGSAYAMTRGGSVSFVDIPVNMVGSIAGRVKLSHNAANMSVRNIIVHLVDMQGHVVAQARTTRDGDYNFDEVQYGTYRVTIERELNKGFHTTSNEDKPFTISQAKPDIILATLELAAPEPADKAAPRS